MLLHSHRTTASFNQDTLIEKAVEEAGLPDWGETDWGPRQQTISWMDVTEGLPPAACSRGLAQQGPQTPTRTGLTSRGCSAPPGWADAESLNRLGPRECHAAMAPLGLDLAPPENSARSPRTRAVSHHYA